MFKLLPSSSKVRSGLFLILIIAIVFSAYVPTLKNDFVFWDDDGQIYENITIRALDYEHIQEIFTDTVFNIYIPFTMLSYAVEHHFFGYDPFIYHLNNLLLHLAVVGLAFWFGLRLGLSVIASGAAALIFGIHPMHVESVAWVTERKDVLYSFFYLLSLLSYCRYLEFTKSTPSIQNKKSYRFLVISVLFGIFSMLSKPMALSLPLILLLLDWFHGRKIWRDAIVEKIPLGLIIAGITWVSYVAHARVPGKGAIEGILIWAWTFVFYLRKFLFPFILAPIYQLPKPITFSNFEYLSSIIVVCLIAFSIFKLRKYRWWIFSIGFYFFSIFFLLRYDEMKDANIVADRFMYLPSLGFCFLLGLGIQRILERKKRQYIISTAVVMMILTAILTVKTYQQCHIWRSSIALWQYQIGIYPNEPIALNNLAAALREEDDYKTAESMYRKYKAVEAEGFDVEFSEELSASIKRVEELEGLYKKAIRSQSNFVDSYYNLGNLYRDVGMISEAVEQYKNTLKYDHKYKDAHFSLGELYQKVGDFKQAIYAYDQTIRLNSEDEDVYVLVISAYNDAIKKNPENISYRQARKKAMDSFAQLIASKPPKARSFFNLGYLYSGMGNINRAVSAYQMALDINPNHSNTLYNFGNILRDQGLLKDALEMYQRAVKIDPKKSDAYLNIGTIHGRNGNHQEARKNFQMAIKADRFNPRAYFDLGYIEENTGNVKEAIELYKKSVNLDSKSTEAYYNLGNAYAKLNRNADAIKAYLQAIEADSRYTDAWINLSILSFKEGDFDNAVKYHDEAAFLGYNAPQGYLNALKPYRK